MAQKYSLTRRASLPGIANYDTFNELPLTNVTPGRLAWVNSVQKLYVYDGAWQTIDTQNLPPVFSGLATTLNLQVGVEYSILLANVVTDPDGLPLEYTLSTSGITDVDTIVEIDTAGNLIIFPGYTPEQFTVTVTASDGIEQTSHTITVTAINTAPTIVPIDTQYPIFNPNSAYTVPLAFQDIDVGDSVTWSVLSTSGIDISKCSIVDSNNLAVLIDAFYDPFTVTVRATQFGVTVDETVNFTVVADIPAGEVLADSSDLLPGTTTYQWTVPQGVTSVSAVAIGSGGTSVRAGSRDYYWGGGGGALSYSTNITVTPGETLDIVSDANGYGIKRSSTWLLYAENGKTAVAGVTGAANVLGGQASNGIGDVKYSGGYGGYHLDVGYTGGMSAGGGAASYTSDGGNSGQVSTTTRTGGGVGSSEGGSSFYPSGNYPITYDLITDPPASGSLAGGGVGIYGTIFSNDDVGIKGGGVYGGESGSRRWTFYSTNAQNPYVFNGEYATNPYNYGGGRGIFDTEGRGGAGWWGDAGNAVPYNGAVRIIYGSGRSYPGSGTQVVPQTPIFTSPVQTFSIAPGQTRTFTVTAESLEANPVTYSVQMYDANTEVTLSDVSIIGNEVSVTLPTTAKDADDFQIIVLAEDTVTTGVVGQIVTFKPTIPAGQIFEVPGTHTFTVPDNVYSISVVAVGGGGSGYNATYQRAYNGGDSAFGTSNDPYFIRANGGNQGLANSTSPRAGGTFGSGFVGTYNVDYGGGNGNIGSTGGNAPGGGAGGYTGDGGRGGDNYGLSGTSGTGGGVYLNGQKEDGAGGSAASGGSTAGDPGSGGGGGGGGSAFGTSAPGFAGSSGGVRSQLYGGGGYSSGAGGGGEGGSLRWGNNIPVTPGTQIQIQVGAGGRDPNASSNRGGDGGVRIIWGPNRFFPATNTDNAGIEITNQTTSYTFPQNSTQTISLTVSNPAIENYTWSALPLTDRMSPNDFTFTGDDLEITLPADNDPSDLVFTVFVETDLGYRSSLDFTITPTVASGTQEYLLPGSYSFTVPSGVGSVWGVAVGGGGGGFENGSGGGGGGLGWGEIPVSEGDTISIDVGAAGLPGLSFKAGIQNQQNPTAGGDSVIKLNGTPVIAGYGGTAGQNGSNNFLNLGGSFLAPTVGGGGDGGGSYLVFTSPVPGGGGAGGYTGKGGNGGRASVSAEDGTGGGGGGGYQAQTLTDSSGGGGGGTGIYGLGPNGLGSTGFRVAAEGGSGGNDGGIGSFDDADGFGGDGGFPGGGGGGSQIDGGAGAGGAVRLIYGPASTTSYPNNAGV